MTTLLKKHGRNDSGILDGKIEQELFPYLSPELRALLGGLSHEMINDLEEIRLRVEQPVLLRFRLGDGYLTSRGTVTKKINDALICRTEFVKKTVLLLCQSSLYAREEELQKGYLTLPGGHRAGFSGRAVLEQGRVKTLKQISGINIRIARFVKGVALPLMGYLVEGKNFLHTLIVSPPRCGKTTLLRDIVIYLSNGFTGFSSVDVGVVDERSEIAGCRDGIPQLPVGHRTDVLDGCPKAEGMMMLVRSMAPAVIATDEIGRLEDVVAVQEVLNAGIKLLVTAHGSDLEELGQRPGIGEIVRQQVFERYVILSRKFGPGTVEAVLNREGTLILSRGEGRC